MGCVVSGMSLVRSISSIGLTRAVRGRTTGRGLATGVLVRMGITRRRDGFKLGARRILPFVRGVTGFRRVGIYKLVAVTPFISGPRRGHRVFTGLRGLSISVGRGGVSGICIGVLSVKVAGSCRITVRRKTAVIQIKANVFNTEGCGV